MQLSKNRRSKPSKPIHQEPKAFPPETPNTHQTFSRNFRASSSVASSAAALVGERFIGDTPETSQHTKTKKIKFLVSRWFVWGISNQTPKPPKSAAQSPNSPGKIFPKWSKSPGGCFGAINVFSLTYRPLVIPFLQARHEDCRAARQFLTERYTQSIQQQ